jgi:DNA-binding LacI/PurR family transcriptional regulator
MHGGQRAARQLLQRRGVPAAIFAWTDYEAAGVMAALDQEGLQVLVDYYSEATGPSHSAA